MPPRAGASGVLFEVGLPISLLREPRGRCAVVARSSRAVFLGEVALARPITVKIKRLAHGGDLPLPAFATEHAAGADLHAAVGAAVTLEPGEIRLIPCGFAMA